MKILNYLIFSMTGIFRVTIFLLKYNLIIIFDTLAQDVTYSTIESIKEDIWHIRNQQVQLRMMFNRYYQDNRMLEGRIEVLEFHSKSIANRLEQLILSLDNRLDQLGTYHKQTNIKQKSDSTVMDNIAQKEGLSNPDLSNAFDLYNTAIILMQNQQYIQARKILLELCNDYKEHVLTSDVLYWIGETYYVEQDYENAIDIFTRNVLEYPDGSKIHDSLLRLGLALGNIGRNEEACHALTKIPDDYKSLNQELILLRDKAKQSFVCNKQ